MKWITRENVKVDRVACPWLIRRFVDPDAEFTACDVHARRKSWRRGADGESHT